ICSTKKTSTYVPKLAVVNTNYASIKIFKNIFGGKIRKRAWKGANKAKWKPCYEWSLVHKSACEAIEKLQPYLKIKTKQAKLVLELRDVRNSHPAILRRWDKSLKKKVDKKFYKLKTKCQALNKRGL